MREKQRLETVVSKKEIHSSERSGGPKRLSVHSEQKKGGKKNLFDMAVKALHVVQQFYASKENESHLKK